MLNAAWILSLALAVQSVSPGTGAKAVAPARTPAQTPAPAAAPTPVDPWPDDRPITHLFQNLWHDIVALPSPSSAWILAVGGGGALAAHQADQSVSDWAVENGAPSYTDAGRVLGDGLVQAGAAVGVYAIGKLAHSPQAVHVGSDLIRTQVLNGLMTTGIKVAVDRERPNGGRYAFPSGHTSAAFGTAAVLQTHYGWKVGVPAYAAAGFVGWTRVRDNVHWLSDVVFGAAIGTMAGHTVTLGHRGDRWAVVPTPVKGGMGVMFTKVR